MVININVQYNGGFLPNILGYPLEYHEEVMYL